MNHEHEVAESDQPTNPITEILNNKVEALAKSDDTGKWCGIIAYAGDHPTLAHEPILETAFDYDSEREAKGVMTVEIARLVDAVNEFRAADAAAKIPETQ